MEPVRQSRSSLGRLWRHFTADVSSRDLQRLFDRDAARVWHVLTRDAAMGPEPKGRAGRWWFRFKLLLVGLSSKLSPPRRLLFGVALVAAVVGLVNGRLQVEAGDVTISLPSFYWFVSVGLLVFLLALELADRLLVRDELEVARQLQRDLLPSTVPTLAGYGFAQASRTANEVGGDYHDYIPLPDGRLALVIGDASGHGMAAGLLMAIASAVLQLALELDPTLDRVFALVNRVLCRTGDRRAFMSFFVGLLDPASGRLDYACAGHPFPLLRRASGQIEELGRGGLPLGLRPSLTVTPATTSLAAGDLLVLYSDGLPEAANRAGEPLGFEKVRGWVGQGGTPPAVVARLLAGLDLHAAGEPLRDDLSLLVMDRDTIAPSTGA
ncbi:MAG TPA: PP2C family protein-serine/threonine phosphatase [Thermoanaerobaculaceae bacterium]|nr:PP2C family protein-serine/threonine phosphatase [Thermoanaerobaculaceae bacterium]HPS77634.1 PP2C family protein-serine/threonine phosphatase [Thermoanaerobaculaceae bacterium]